MLPPFHITCPCPWPWEKSVLQYFSNEDTVDGSIILFCWSMYGHFTLFLFLKTSAYFAHEDVLRTIVVEQREQIFYCSRFSCNNLFLSVVGRYAAGQIKCCSHDALCQFQRQSYDSDESPKGQCTSFHSLEVLQPSYESVVLFATPSQLFSVLFCQDSSKNIQIEAFHVFKVCMYNSLDIFLSTKVCLNSFGYYCILSQLFAANKNKPPEVVNILVTNRSKLLRFFAGFKIDKGTIPAFNFRLCTCLLIYSHHNTIAMDLWLSYIQSQEWFLVLI